MTVEFKTDVTRTPSTMMSIATPLRESQAYVTAKGLTNHPGQNNCFLNSSIQVLWHLDAFRRSFRDLTGHACLAESCIFCALKELFSELQHSRAKALPPDSLRKALADSFLDQQRFQIGFMDDAAECFENMLLRIHEHIAHREPEDACSAPHCISHQKFAMTLVEQSICRSCGATTEPMSFTQMVQYVSTSSLVHQLHLAIDQTGRPDPFGRLLQKASNMGDTRPCPASCGSVTQMRRILMNRPEIVSIGLVWNSEKPNIEHIMEVFSCIDTTLNLNHVFNTVTDSRWAESTTHNLVGMVTYYGKHYSTFFFHTKLMEWIFLDDATVRDVGPRWEQVVDKCKKGKFQPLLLLYATPNGTPVNLEYAPKLNTPFQTKSGQQLLRRSVTPSPEKPNIGGNTRRAITPNPENSPLNQKPPLPKPYNDYQNLSVIQKNINGLREVSGDQIDGHFKFMPHDAYNVKRKSLDNGKPQVNIHRTLSNGSSSGVESGASIPDHMNVPRRRDSGNWSGDRNSASSASSTTMENPYLYLVGKMPPGSPTKVPYDAGYDSYSLSSNDSSNNMTTLQHMMKSGHLAQIPEDYTNMHSALGQQNSQSCDVLCTEADELLIKSRQLEDAHDLVLALALCNAAATKARAAMNAPYNNPQTLTLARMKHNTCIMRARSLHRRMTQQNQPQNKEGPLEIRHTREGSSGSGRHSRQNSREKGHHSRQSSRELLVQQEKEKAKPIKSIEIYATLPKKKDALKAKLNAISIDDDAEYMLYTKPPERESRSIFSRSKNKDKDLKVKEKRSRSEDRNKISRSDFSVAPEICVAKEITKKGKHKDKEEKEDKKDKDGKNKKQHKIRRKLLMGGLIRRKNRSMPDLTDSNVEDHRQSPQCIDDSQLSSPDTSQGMTGYLSEGHLEFTGSSANPKLERSKLMRKSFHGSAGKILTAAKVPPPPPLRTTSQLSRSKSNVSEASVSEQYNIYGDVNIYHNLSAFNQPSEEQSSMSLPYYGNCNSSYDDDSFDKPSSHTVVTQAQVHQEISTSNTEDGVDEVDCFPSRPMPMLDLPPYPSPAGSAIHSRQASEEFPPPPPPLDLSALDEYLPKLESERNSLLAQLQDKRKQILTQVPELRQQSNSIRSSGDTWLKELQAKQAALKDKKGEVSRDVGVDEVNTQRYLPGDSVAVKSVKDLASKFENSRPTMALNKAKTEISTIAPEQIAEEIREVEMITSAVNKVFASHSEKIEEKTRPQKKKSVSFCDQVILVATADEQEEETYIPNPILERVLRSAVNSPEANTVKQELMALRENMAQQQPPVELKPAPEVPQLRSNDIEQPLYVRRNSIEHLLNPEPLRPLPHTPYMAPNYPSSPLPQQQYLTHPQNYGVRADEQYYAYQKAPQPYYSRGPSEQQFSYEDAQYKYQQPQKYTPNVSTSHNIPPRQSPYQPVPYNSASHYGHSSPQNPPHNNYGYPPPSSSYNQPNTRLSASSPGYLTTTLTPSPVPSVSSCSNYYPEGYRNGNQSPFQRVPEHQNFNQEYQRQMGYQMSPEIYQRVPPPHGDEPIYPSQANKISPYQQVPSPKNFPKKSVSFQPGTKGCESPIPKAVITPIVVNNANNSIPTDKTKCNLCRKKNVVALNVYCKDCEFYMSRFKPMS
ncbi:uncharacterized protein ec isoform X1 [Euwallacea fornicatus]|uniref:uncharacterized protein ec isoform X1 n=1 Tax=Euwallacea fornicatus TaxID=995702 RepID=UPI00338EB1FB